MRHLTLNLVGGRLARIECELAMRQRDFVRSMTAGSGTAVSRPRCAAWRNSSVEFREISDNAKHVGYTQLKRPLVGTDWHGHTFFCRQHAICIAFVQLPLQAWCDWEQSVG